ncbi:glycoside hydrolase family 3 N-terminal domain-containing protein [Paenarthrobacter sp. Z7-10]|uniref:glycoside hydrolase family 3 N-terminal domain-containing protein n=1 Tax=Paenarthrobacter sp. Z7-10 TaxID=2787635 RepID=UPI0022A8F741|nr:glycoside hydrolase family 3 N-terminal domain-containing protein [Paenarthrobacter sp. Z7-10]
MQKVLQHSALFAAVLALMTASGLPPATAAAVVVGAPPATAAVVVGGPSRPAAGATTASTPEQQLASMTLPQRVGQLFMVAAAATGADNNTMSDLTNYHVGNVYLAGRSYAGVAATAAVVRRMTATVSAASTAGIPLFVSTDQEGGNVQVLNGPGFSVIPTALNQGGMTTSVLQANARFWGGQLRAAGLNVDLAPVLDTVPSAQFAPYNAPIGYFGREYGFTPQTVASHGGAFAAGMRQAGVAPVVKHFPGLGRVTLNTDTSSNVHDTATTRTDSYLLPFRSAIQAGVRWVMISNAYYDRIDPTRIGPFSPVIMRNMLRGDLGFNGIIVSDDVCSARQLSSWSLGVRATNFIAAGGTMLLCANPASIPAMYSAVLHLAQTSPVFLAQVNAAALKNLQVKAGGGAPNSPKDFNGDGHPDVLARDGAGLLWLYPGDGHGGWLSRIRVGSGWNGFTGLVGPGDFNGDGRPDVLARDGAGLLWLYPGNGHGGWLSRIRVGSGWNGFTGLVGPGDFNGDGHPDVLARDGAGLLWLYPGNGHGGWLPRSQVGWGWNGFNALVGPGDFNGDGHPDVLARDGAGLLWLYPGNGHGGWLSRIRVGSGWNTFSTVF